MNARTLPWPALAAIILCAGLIRFSLIDLPLERDEGEYALVGQMMLHGIPPYQAVWNMKFPGTYAAYALIMAIGGQSTQAIHFGLLVVNALTTLLLYLLARRFFGAGGALTACGAFALLSLGAGVAGFSAHATHFVMLFAVAGALLLFQATGSGSAGRLFLSGVLFGVALLMKQQGALFAVFGAVWLFINFRTAARGLFGFALGAALPFALTCLILWNAGVFPAFWFWTFRYAREYALEASLADGREMLGLVLPRIARPNLGLLLLAAAGLVLIWCRADRLRSALPLTLFLFFSILAVCPGFYFREHYFVLMLPAVALLIGAAVDRLPPAPAIMPGWLRGSVVVSLWAAAMLFSLWQQREFLFEMNLAKATRYEFGFNPFPEAIEIAGYIRSHTPPGARVGVLGSEPEICFYADRTPATGYIYMYPLMEHQPFALQMQKEMIREIELTKPDYVVLVSIPTSWSRRINSETKIFEWWSAYGPLHYSVTGVADIVSPELTNYFWDADAAQRPLPPFTFIAVERRKPDSPATLP